MFKFTKWMLGMNEEVRKRLVDPIIDPITDELFVQFRIVDSDGTAYAYGWMDVLTLSPIELYCKEIPGAEIHHRMNGTWKKITNSDLFDEDPDCLHILSPRPGGGVECSKCKGWFCY
jgi:hypothetical protein